MLEDAVMKSQPNMRIDFGILDDVDHGKKHVFCCWKKEKTSRLSNVWPRVLREREKERKKEKKFIQLDLMKKSGKKINTSLNLISKK